MSTCKYNDVGVHFRTSASCLAFSCGRNVTLLNNTKLGNEAEIRPSFSYTKNSINYLKKHPNDCLKNGIQEAHISY